MSSSERKTRGRREEEGAEEGLNVLTHFVDEVLTKNWVLKGRGELKKGGARDVLLLSNQRRIFILPPRLVN